MLKIIPVVNLVGDVLFFGHINIGETFTYNGTVYKKQSSRTARLQDYPSQRVFYFASNDRCIIC